MLNTLIKFNDKLNVNYLLVCLALCVSPRGRMIGMTFPSLLLLTSAWSHCLLAVS